jgi:phosphomannomutase
MFTLQGTDRVIVRPSGTEPKIKFYVLLSDRDDNLAEARTKCEQRAAAILTDLTSLVES